MNSHGPQRPFKPLSWILVFALLGGATWYLLKTPAKKADSAAATPPPAEVIVGKPLQLTIVEWDDYVGRFEAIDSVDVRARVSGYLASTHFIEGQIVKAGDLLAVIDQRPFVAELNKSKGELAEAKGRHEQSQAAVIQASAEADRAIAHRDLTEKQLERNRVLRQRNAVSQEDLDVAEAAFLTAQAELSVANSKIESAKSNLVAAQAGVEAVEAMVEIAELNLGFSEVRAPINGRISRRYVTEGNMISGGSSESTLLTNIVSLNPIHCYFDADEQTYLKYMKLAREGLRTSSRDARNPVYAALANDHNTYPFLGHMDFVDNRVDRQTGTIRGRAIFTNDDFALTPGMFGRLRLPGSPSQQTVLVPDRAVGTDQAEKFVLAVNASNEVERKLVTLGPISHGLRIVRSGLDGNERIIISGLQRVRPGLPVNVVREDTIEAKGESLPDTYEPIPIEKAISPRRLQAGNLPPVSSESDLVPATGSATVAEFDSAKPRVGSFVPAGEASAQLDPSVKSEGAK